MRYIKGARAIITEIRIIWKLIAPVVADLDLSDLAGPDRLRKALSVGATLLDEHADGLPLWNQLSERHRDMGLEVLVELILVAVRNAKNRRR